MKITFAGKNGDPMEEISKEINILNQQVRQDVDRLAHDTLKVIKDYVHDSKVRPQAGEETSLENALEVDMFTDGWGIGDIERLKKEAPGWAALNWGSSHMVGKHMPPYFTPGFTPANSELFREGRVNYKGPKGNKGPIVQNAIQPINYIERAIFWLSQKIDELKG